MLLDAASVDPVARLCAYVAFVAGNRPVLEICDFQTVSISSEIDR